MASRNAHRLLEARHVGYYDKEEAAAAVDYAARAVFKYKGV